MRFLVRLLGAIWIATLLVTVGFAWLEVQEERSALVSDLQHRASLAVDAVREASERLVGRHARTGYDRILTRFSREDRAVAIYDDLGGLLAASPAVRPDLGVISPLVSEAMRTDTGVRGMRVVGGAPAWVQVVPLVWEDHVVGAAAVLLDARHLESREWSLWRRTAARFGVLALLLTGITFVLVRSTVTRPIARMAEWTKQLKAGQAMPPPLNADVTLFGPLASEVDGLARSLARARAAAEREARLRLAGESIWTEERLKQFVRARFGDRPIFVVSNREPVSHVRDGGTVRVLRPASGLVTALEPVMMVAGGAPWDRGRRARSGACPAFPSRDRGNDYHHMAGG